MIPRAFLRCRPVPLVGLAEVKVHATSVWASVAVSR